MNEGNCKELAGTLVGAKELKELQMEDEKTEKARDNLLRIFVFKRYGEPVAACWTKEEAEEMGKFFVTSDGYYEVPIVQLQRRMSPAEMF